MQPGYPPSGQDPYGQPYTDPSGQGQGQYGTPQQQPEPPKPQEYQQQGNPNDPAPSPFAPDYSQPQQFTMPQSYEQQSYEQPQQPQQPQTYEQPQTYAQPPYEQPPPPAYQQQQPPPAQYADPYAQPTSGAAPGYPTSGAAQMYPTSGPTGYPVSGGAYTTGYPPPGYQVPGYGPPQGGGSANALGIVSLVFGILGILVGCCGFYGLVLPIPAIICGILGMRKADQGLANNKGLSIAGLVCGVAGLLISITVIVLIMADAMSGSPYS